MFQQFRDQMEVFDCTFDIENNGRVQHSKMQAPRIAIEHQFIELVQQAVNYTEPVKVTMRRIVPIYYNNLDDKWINREVSVSFANNAYVRAKGE